MSGSPRGIGKDRARAKRARPKLHASPKDRADLTVGKAGRSPPGSRIVEPPPVRLGDRRSVDRAVIIAPPVNIIEPVAPLEPAVQTVARQQKSQSCPQRKPFIPHRRNNEDLVEAQIIGEMTVELDIGKQAPGQAEVAMRRLPQDTGQ